MSKKTELLTSNYMAQITWLRGQIAKNNGAIFLNSNLAIKAWNELEKENTSLIDDQDVEAFMSRYLSKSGEDKLYTTLRVAETRAKKNSFRLQCNIEYSANQKLEVIVAKTGLSKGELISKLIEQSGVTLLQCNDEREEPEEHPEEIQDELPLDEWVVYTKFSQVKAGTVMRSIDSGIEHVVYDRDGKTILFEDSGELDAHQAKKKYEIKR
jgi:vacuolar-type H+-ATPase subunit I/STV1